MAILQYSGICESPLGLIAIDGTDFGITSVAFVEHSPNDLISSPLIAEAMNQLEEYFSGKRNEFSLLLSPEGTEFQKQVWNALQSIPFSETRSYLDIALQLGDKNLTRAVGAANGKNPIAIIIHCHRVIGEDGSLTGYAGGLHRKQWLLNFESPVQQQSLFAP
ncbi:MAG: methylated-DNA--[protein]-cysteine S-methyltransferase [bacterium]